MKLPRRFRIVITGDTLKVLAMNNCTDSLAWALSRLLAGQEVGDLCFAPFMLAIEAEEDMDQGEG